MRGFPSGAQAPQVHEASRTLRSEEATAHNAAKIADFVATNVLSGSCVDGIEAIATGHWTIAFCGAFSVIDQRGEIVKIVVIGGTGSSVRRPSPFCAGVATRSLLRRPKPANTITGEGLRQILCNTAVVIDVTNPPSFDDKAVLELILPDLRALTSADGSCCRRAAPRRAVDCRS